MFDLENEIAAWRLQTADAVGHAPEVLEELEGHLRDDIEQQMRAGLDAPHAFAEAVRHMGKTEVLQEEFAKVPETLLSLGQRIRNALSVLTGIPTLNPAFAMNGPNLSVPTEPRWATYLKTGVFLSPALLLWVFASLFLIPKVQKLCQEAGMQIFGIMKVSLFMEQHATLLLLGFVVLMVLLEWRSSAWPRYRKMTMGVGAFLLNAAVLLLITTLVVSATIAAPSFHH